MIRFPKKKNDISTETMINTIWVSTFMAMIFSLPPLGIFLGIYFGTGNLVIGKESIMFLFNTELDYVSQIFGSNFEIRNPNAKSSCGCGVSVNFDFEKLKVPA